MTKYLLSFGRNIPSSTDTVSDSELTEFLENVVSKHFQGFTLTQATGYWKGEKEEMFRLEIIAEIEDYEKIQIIALHYKNQFKQDSVMIEQMPTTVEF
jgi:Protein of unknown function (DUF3574)